MMYIFGVVEMVNDCEDGFIGENVGGVDSIV